MISVFVNGHSSAVPSMNTEFLAAMGRIVEKGGSPKFQCNQSSNLVNGPQSALGEISVEASETDGNWLVSWKSLPTAVYYEIQSNPDPSQYRGWVTRMKVKMSRVELGLNEGEDRIWLRVRAMTGTGPGPWSQPMVLGALSHRCRRAA